MFNIIRFQKKNFFHDPEVPPGAQSTVKSENHFSIAKSTSFYSEFDADSEYVILFKKFFVQKNGLTATCPFTVFNY
jgi:hypothetical protein